MSDGKTQKNYSVPPVERALKLLRYIGDGNRARNLSAVSSELGINRTTLIRLIHTLMSQRMIEEIGDGAGYRLGAGLVSLGAQAIQGRDIVHVCRPILRDLCLDTGLSAHLGILDGREIIYLSRETPNSHLVSNVREGSRLLAHASSIGRAILAETPEEQIRRAYSESDVEQVTDKTPASLDEVLYQARADKAAGVAWSRGNFESGIGSCAAVIFDHAGEVAGGINVSGPEARFADPETPDGMRIKIAVREAAQKASSELGYVTR